MYKAKTGDMDEYPHIIYTIFGDYARHPNFPMFNDIVKFTVKNLSIDDWTALEEALASDEHKEFRQLKYLYDPVKKTFIMSSLQSGHRDVICAYEAMAQSAIKSIAAPERLLKALDLGSRISCATRAWAWTKINNLYTNKYPDSLYTMQVGKYYRLNLGPMEVGSSQSLHGVKGVLGMLEEMAQWQELALQNPDELCPWPAMTAFKIYEEGHPSQMKEVVWDRAGGTELVKELVKEEVNTGTDGFSWKLTSNIRAEGGENSLSTLPLTLDDLYIRNEIYSAAFGGTPYKAGYRYTVFENDPTCKDTSLLLPGCGPWYAHDKRITGVIRLLWFHIPWNRLTDFYRILPEAMHEARQNHHEVAENLWIEAGLAIPVLPCDAYVGELLVKRDTFLASVAASFQVVVHRLAAVWAGKPINDRVLASKIPGVAELYLEYLVTLEHCPPIDWTPIFDELISSMAIAMEETARDRTNVSRLGGADSVDIPSEWGAIQAIIQAAREETEELLRKRKRELEGSASENNDAGKSLSESGGYMGKGAGNGGDSAGSSDGRRPGSG